MLIMCFSTESYGVETGFYKYKKYSVGDLETRVLETS